MAGSYKFCPACLNTSKGTILYRCEKCKNVFCRDCQEKGLGKFLTDLLTFADAKCPHCDNHPTFGIGITKLGYIE